MKRLRLAMLAPFCLVFASPAAAAVKVIATVTDLAAIAHAVGGERIAVTSLAPGTSDPHFLEARPSMIRRVHEADLLIAVGAELEVGWLPAVLQAARNAKVQPGATGYLDVSAAVQLLKRPAGPVSRAMGDVHASGNPHYLLDPGNGLRAAAVIASRLRQIDPDGASVYDAGQRAFEARLAEKIETWRARLRPLGGRAVITYHRSMVYLAAAFGFRIAAEVEPLPGIAPTAAHLNAVIETIKAESVRTLLMEPFYERRSARFLAERTGIAVAIIPTAVGATAEAGSYIELFDAIVSALARAGAI